MKAKHYVLAVLAGLVAFLAGYFIGKDRTENPPGIVVETTETTVDTIPYRAPMPQSELSLGTHRYTLPTYRFIGGGSGGEPRPQSNKDNIRKNTIHADTIKTLPYGTGAGGEPRCCGDSAIVELPIIQRHYTDSTYEAWVSGPIAPRLDSVRLFVPTTIITKREWKPPKRWHIGPTLGFGYTPHGVEPFVGVSLTYSIIDL